MILIIDEKKSLFDVYKIMFQKRGYFAKCFSNFHDATRYAKKYHQEISYLIFDFYDEERMKVEWRQ